MLCGSLQIAKVRRLGRQLQTRTSKRLLDAAFLLAVGSFLLTVELFLLTVDNFSFFTYSWSFLLTILAFCLQSLKALIRRCGKFHPRWTGGSFSTYSWSFLLTGLAFLLTLGASLLTVGKCV